MRIGPALSVCATVYPTSLPLFSADVSELAVGKHSAASFLAATGLTFTRTTASLVETAPGVIDKTPAINDVCVGDLSSNGTKRGVVNQQNVRGLIFHPRNLNGTGWPAGFLTTVTQPAVASPDGTTPTNKADTSSGGYTNFADTDSVPPPKCLSAYLRSVNPTGGDQQLVLTPDGATGVIANGVSSQVWARFVASNTGAARRYACVSDCRDYSGAGGQSARARIVYADYFLLVKGGWAPTPIATITGLWPSGYRDADFARILDGSVWTNGETVSFRATLFPMFPSTMTVEYEGQSGAGTSSKWMLWDAGTGAPDTFQAFIHPTTKKLTLIIDGVSHASTEALSWVIGDRFEIFMLAGNGEATVAKYRKNGGAWIPLTIASFADPAIFPAEPAAVFRSVSADPDGDVQAFPCHWQSFDWGGPEPI